MTEQSTAGSNEALLHRYSSALTGVFGAPSRVLVRGEGVHVWDADGRRYTDFLGGIAVNALGHAHPALVRAVTEQLGTLGHISNLFTSEQGESGVHGWPAGYLQAAREATRRHGALLVFDEVQSGTGRTGTWFAHQNPAVTGQDTAVVPDAMTLAKGLGGGLPIGALISFGARASQLLTAGQHGTTFGGNPVATAAGLAVLDTIVQEGLLEHARSLGARLAERLRALDAVARVRQYGLLLGVDVTVPAGSGHPVPDGGLAPALVRAGLEAGYLLNATGPDTLRLAPPLVMGEQEADRLVAELPSLLAAALGPDAPAQTPSTPTQETSA